MRNQSIAIIGMSGRFAGARSIEEFYEKIWSGTELITQYTEGQLLKKGVDPQLIANKHYVRSSSTPADAECFDADFFKYSTREAQAMDPQQRLFLECCWEAIERAGYNIQGLEIPVGVFAGASANTYILDNLLKGRVDIDLDFMNYVETRLGSDKDFLATRVSYKFNLTGPSYTLQSACSTSLLAVHTACQNLLNGECDMALAGAVTILYPLEEGYTYKPGSMVSPDGHCRPFSSAASGTVFGSGVGVVVLKRLQEALDDRDNVLAVIRGSAVNNDGALKPSYTTPSLDLQAEVVADAMVLADVAAESIGYVEAHGTGTPIGDPVEVSALTQAYREFTDKRQYCAIGSVKSNIGHLDVASGMASLIKSVLILQHGQIPPTLHFDEPNPKIDFENSPFYVNTKLRPFPRGETPRRVGVTSLGVGGTNIHMILEEAPDTDTIGESVVEKTTTPQLLLVSAKTPEALSRACINLATHLSRERSLSLADVAYTTQVCRQAFTWRQAFVCVNISDAINQLKQFSFEQATPLQTDKVRLLLADLKAEDIRIVLDLYAIEAEFRKAFVECVLTWNRLCKQLDQSQKSWQLPEDHTIGMTDGLARDVSFHPLLAFFCAYSLVQWFLAKDLKPVDIVAIGQAELIGAVVSQALPLSVALAIIAHHHHCFDEAQVASLRRMIHGISIAQPVLPLYLCQHEQWLTALNNVTDAASLLNYHAKHDAANFAGKAFPPADGCVFLAIGSSAALNEILATNKHPPAIQLIDESIDSPPAESLSIQLLTAIALLWQSGIDISWRSFHNNQPRHRLVLPTYPFERKIYRYDEKGTDSSNREKKRKGDLIQPLLHHWIHSPAIGKSIFECDIDFAHFPYLNDHRLFGQAIVPGSFHISMVLSATHELLGNPPLVIDNLRFGKALFIEDHSSRKLQLTVDLSSNNDCQMDYQLVSCAQAHRSNAEAWTIHSQGRINATPQLKKPETELIEHIKQRCRKRVSHGEFYQRGRKQGFEWQGDFRSLTSMWQGHGEALALLEYSAKMEQCINAYTIHPAILDACLQPYLLTLSTDTSHVLVNEPYIPLSIERLVFHQRPTKQLWIHACLRTAAVQNVNNLCVDMVLYNVFGDVVMAIEALRAVRMSKVQLREAANAQLAEKQDFIYRPFWQLTPPVSTTDHPAEVAHVVIIDHGQDPWGFANTLIRYYRKRNRTLQKPNSTVTVDRISLGQAFHRHSSSHLEIDHRNPSDYDQLAEFVTEGSTLYFLGGLAQGDDIHALQQQQQTIDETAIFERTQAYGVVALLRLTQALIRRQKHPAVTIKIITHDLYHITEADSQLYPFAGGLVGFAKVLSREQPQMDVACIDVSSRYLEALADDTTAANRLITAIEQEVGSVNLREIAWRDGLRFCKKLIKYTSLAPVASSRRLRQQGVYLIVGGAGGIGVELSLLLAKKYQARLVWVGRSNLSPVIAANIAKVEAAGGQVLYLRANAGELEEMQVVRNQIRQYFGPLNGVVHSALVLRDQSIEKMQAVDFRTAFDIKAKAAVIIEQITRDEPLDFIAYFSSENALRGWHGLSNYVAGCTFKDNYGHYLKHRHKRPVTIFNWGFWGESGIAARQGIRKLIEKQGIYPITNAEGLSTCLAGLDQQALSQILATRIDSRINEQLAIDAEIESSQASVSLPSVMPAMLHKIAQSRQDYAGESDNHVWVQRLIARARYLGLSLIADLGVKVLPGGTFDRENIMQDARIEKKFSPLFAAMEAMLEKAGYLVVRDGCPYFTTAVEILHTNDPVLAGDDLVQTYPEAASWVKLIDVCVKQFVPVVQGRVKATDVLFPDGSNELVENIYRGNCVSDYFNNLACDAVVCFVEQQFVEHGAEIIRLLEFGAGTGSTSRILLNRLKQEFPTRLAQINYIYTDVSAHFTNKARKQLAAEYPFVRFRTFDMEKNPRQQGLATGTFDLILGTNVIHVCVDMLATLRRLKSMLKQNGVLVLNELTAINDIWTLTFGLLDGWWLANDGYLRIPHTPLLSAPSWTRVLSARGFTHATAFAQPHVTTIDNAWQALILSQSDGFIETAPYRYELEENSVARQKRAPDLTAETKNRKAFLTFIDVAQADADQRYSLLSRYLREKIADTLRISISDIADNKPLGEMGMDSLIVLDFCDALAKEMQCAVPTTMVFDYPTLALMTEYVMKNILQWPEGKFPQESKACKRQTAFDEAAVLVNDNSPTTPDLNKLSAEKINELLEAELDR